MKKKSNPAFDHSANGLIFNPASQGVGKERRYYQFRIIFPFGNYDNETVGRSPLASTDTQSITLAK